MSTYKYPKNKIIYQLTVEDIHNVSEEKLERQLTNEEMEKIISILPDFIDWYGAIENSIERALNI